MVNSSVKDERTVSFPQRHKLLFSTSQPNNRPITDSPRGTQCAAVETKPKLYSTLFLCKLLHWIQVWCPHLLLAPLYACGPSCSSVSWCSCARMKRFQLWMRRPRRAFPVCSSESARINLTLTPPGLSGKPGENYWPVKKTNKCLCMCICYAWLTALKALIQLGMNSDELKVLVYLAGVSSAQVQHVKKESQLTGQTELLLTQMILNQAPDWLQEVQHLPQHTQNWLTKFQRTGTVQSESWAFPKFRREHQKFQGLRGISMVTFGIFFQIPEANIRQLPFNVYNYESE